ncbi:PfkB family carbohydrate kinase, partial [Streptomyces sp. NPDC096153]|uniref:PfkB family carbohydrate kinase n=1 Tax=Streptomyces sp. NPDC096153 TaxID=3155548 RepID=UPI00332905DC
PGGRGAFAPPPAAPPAGAVRPAPARTRDTGTHVPAPHVDVVAPVGAGDAFAAGFLSATLRGLPVGDRLRHGHLMAAAALTVPGDLGSPPPAGPSGPDDPAGPGSTAHAPTAHAPTAHAPAARYAAPLALAYADRLVALDDDRWGTLHLGPGWTAAAQATEEVRTP